ncbi:unnamed protein product, partial [Meganyctiphanes norvegica]
PHIINMVVLLVLSLLCLIVPALSLPLSNASPDTDASPDTPYPPPHSPYFPAYGPQHGYNDPYGYDQPPEYGYGHQGYENEHAHGYESHPKYDFRYAVIDEPSYNDFGHEESRDGYDTEGSYFVNLPDGRTQTVYYEVHGDSGFLASVSYEGEAQYPPDVQQGYGVPPS